MSLVARSGGSATAPQGVFAAVCSQVLDLGIITGQFGPKPKVQFSWQLDERNPETGQRYVVRQQYTLSIHAKSTLGNHLESWLGKEFTDTERAEGFDLESLKGKTCQLLIVHAPGSKGGVFANVKTITPPPRNFEMLVEPGYGGDESFDPDDLD